MRDFSDTPTPLAIARPRGARMIEARSPKLGRLVQHYDHASFQQWVRLEADPSVSTFCERPARIGPDPTSQLISYWVSRQNAQEFVMLVDGDIPADLPQEHDGSPMRVVSPPELCAAAIWIDNWQRMLPVINCSATHSIPTAWPFAPCRRPCVQSGFPSTKLAGALSREFMQQFIEEKFARAKGTRRAASDLAQTLQTLAGAHTSLSSTMAAASTPAAPATDVEQVSPAQRIEPQRLSIGTGYAGSIWPR